MECGSSMSSSVRSEDRQIFLSMSPKDSQLLIDSISLFFFAIVPGVKLDVRQKGDTFLFIAFSNWGLFFSFTSRCVASKGTTNPPGPCMLESLVHAQIPLFSLNSTWFFKWSFVMKETPQPWGQLNSLLIFGLNNLLIAAATSISLRAPGSWSNTISTWSCSTAWMSSLLRIEQSSLVILCFMLLTIFSLWQRLQSIDPMLVSLRLSCLVF